MSDPNSASTSPAPAIPPVEQMALDPLAFNSWCFNVMANQGARFGFADGAARMQAAFATADAAARFVRLGEAAGVEQAALVAYDQDMVVKTASAAERANGGTLTGAERMLYDACMAKGLSGMRNKALYVDPYENMHQRLWCGDTLTILEQRGKLEGTAEQLADAKVAMGAAEFMRTEIFEFFGVPASDNDMLRMGYLYLALAQVEAFTQSGDRGKFEADPISCLSLAPTDLGDNIPDPEQSTPDRPVLTAAGWDYPLSADFRFNAWCYGAMHYITDGNMPAYSKLSVSEATDLIGDLHFRMLREAKGLGFSEETLAEVEVESYHQAAYEFARPLTNAGESPLSYDYESCARAAVDVGALLDVDSLQAMVDSSSASAPEPASSDAAPDSELDDIVWCIAGLERVLGSETDREKRSALRDGMESLTNRAAWLGSELGLAREAVMERVTDIKPVVDEQIDELRRNDGKRMIAFCLERAVGGYAEEFYDWVEP
ncbi:hypothetical protein [Devosia salina]|uniref:Uncharacterized protein n=1 Tax=Devosia salina TaxID=2860336 RepID=A0ABX8WD61_9HYPH|nr:hypothetical protein [Devosia salina]QYO75519.1 hypothetical protein K1X15_12830 [Devosia salina]